VRIHAVEGFPRDRVIVVENTIIVERCRLSDLVWVAGDDEFVELLMHPDEVDGFIAKFYPDVEHGRLN
jgi:hypothetical protein